MKFDSDGNLFLFEPGAGMSGTPRRVIEFGSDEVIYADEENTSDFVTTSNGHSKFPTLASTKVHRLVPSKGHAITRVCDVKSR